MLKRDMLSTLSFFHADMNASVSLVHGIINENKPSL